MALNFNLDLEKKKIENTRDAHIVPLFFRAHPGNLVASKILVATYVAAAKVDTQHNDPTFYALNVLHDVRVTMNFFLVILREELSETLFRSKLS